jgi:hypothetical protein
LLVGGSVAGARGWPTLAKYGICRYSTFSRLAFSFSSAGSHLAP